MITLTPLQFQLLTATLSEITEGIARIQKIREFNDEQCQVLIDVSVKKTEELDERLEGH